MLQVLQTCIILKFSFLPSNQPVVQVLQVLQILSSNQPALQVLQSLFSILNEGCNTCNDCNIRIDVERSCDVCDTCIDVEKTENIKVVTLVTVVDFMRVDRK